MENLLENSTIDKNELLKTTVLDSKEISENLDTKPETIKNNEWFNVEIENWINLLIYTRQFTPEECKKAQENLKHYKKIAEYLNRNDLLIKIVAKEKQLQTKLKDKEFMEKWPKIIDQYWFALNTAKSKEDRLVRNKNNGSLIYLEPLNKEDSISDYKYKCEYIISQLCPWKAISELRQKDIQELNPEQKAYLAYNITVHAPTNEMEYSFIKKNNLQKKLAFTSQPSEIEKQKIKECFKGRISTMKNIYNSFFKSGEKIPVITQSFTKKDVSDIDKWRKQKNRYKNDYQKFAFDFTP